MLPIILLLIFPKPHADVPLVHAVSFQQGNYRLFDCRTMALAPGTVPLPQTPIILLEGSYSCHPDLWNYCALHAFVNVEPAAAPART